MAITRPYHGHNTAISRSYHGHNTAISRSYHGHITAPSTRKLYQLLFSILASRSDIFIKTFMTSFIWEWKRYLLSCNHQSFLEKIARTHDARYTERPQVTTKWQVFWKSSDLELPVLHIGTRNSRIPEFHILEYWQSYDKPHVTYVERSKALVIADYHLDIATTTAVKRMVRGCDRRGNVTTRRNHGGCRSSKPVMGKLRPAGQTRPPERFYLARDTIPNLTN
jgi:hypothetical protein